MRNTILFLIDSLEVLGGAERNLLSVVSNLNTDKYEIIVCCLKGGNAVKEFEQNGIKPLTLNVERIYGLNAFFKAFKLVRIIQKQRVRILVTYLESSDLWGSIIARLSGVRVVISNRRDMGFNLKSRHIIAYRFINHLFDRIITVCDAVKDNIIINERFNPDKIITIYNGVNVYGDGGLNKAELKRSCGLNTDKSTVTMVANLHPIKGHKDFLRVASEVIKEFRAVQFLLIGTGKNEYTQELKDFANRLGINDSVIFAGFRSNVSELLSISNISVLSSTSEGFSNTVLESMAVGKPVIATNVGGNPEAVVHEETGLLVSPGYNVGFVQSVLRLLKDTELARKMGDAGREKAGRLFTNERMIKDLENIFDILLEQKTSEKKVTIISKKLKKIIKFILIEALYYSGIIYLFEKLRKNNNLRILAYHKVSNICPYLGLAIGISNFRKQMELLKKRYCVISLSEAVDLLERKQKPPKGTVVITFDDGDKEIFHNAFPILQELKIPATIFLTVSPIETKEPVWFEFIIFAIEHTIRKTLNLEHFGLSKYLLNTLRERKVAVEKISLYIKGLNKTERAEFLYFLSKELILSPNEFEKLKDNILEWQDIKEMSRNGLTFGVHTMTHPILTNVSLDEAEHEILESKRILEERIGQNVDLFAYPNGGRNDFNQKIIGILKNNHFSCALTLINDSDNSNLFALRRVHINDDSTTGMNNSFSKALFNYMLYLKPKEKNYA